METLFEIEGAPEILQSDNGREFKNQKMKLFLAEWGVEQIFGRARRPQSQGQVERLNQTVCRAFAKALHNESKRWIDIHSEIVLGYNTTFHSAIGRTPFEAFKKRVFKRMSFIQAPAENQEIEEEGEFFAPDLVWDESISNSENESVELEERIDFDSEEALSLETDSLLSAHNSKYNKKMNSYKQVHQRKKVIEVGDLVLVAKDFDNNPATKRGKFDSFFESSNFEVVEVLDNNTLRIKNENEIRTVSKSKVKKLRNGASFDK